MRLLLIDDDLSTRQTLAIAFGTRGWKVSAVATCADGIRNAELQRFDAGLLDLRLPDGSGLEALSCFRRTQSMDARVYVVTAFGSPHAQTAAAALGATGFVQKPVELDELVSLLSDDSSHSATATDSESCRRLTDLIDAPALKRWVELIKRGAAARCDLRTVTDWCKTAHTSRSTLESHCQAADISAKASLDLLRVLIARREARRQNCRLAFLLDADPRTIRRLLFAAGPLSDTTAPTLEWLDRQQFVANPIAIIALRRALASDPCLVDL